LSTILADPTPGIMMISKVPKRKDTAIFIKVIP
jgi:hypothetical protein